MQRDIDRMGSTAEGRAAAATLSHLQQMQDSAQAPLCGCPFLKGADRTCSIYRARPIDCQLFPLDINMREGEPWWVVYRLPECELSWAITEAHVAAAERAALPLLGDDLETYAEREVLRLWLSHQHFLRPVLRVPTASTTLPQS